MIIVPIFQNAYIFITNQITVYNPIKNKENIILVKYEDFLLDKTGIIKQLSDKLNLTQQMDISHLIDNQFQPKGKKKSVDLIEQGSKLEELVILDYLKCQDKD